MASGHLTVSLSLTSVDEDELSADSLNNDKDKITEVAKTSRML